MFRAVSTPSSASKRKSLPSSIFICATAAVLALFIGAVLNVLPMIGAQEAQAVPVSKGAKAYNLKQDVTYTKYDVTGDKKPDSIRVYATSNYYYNSVHVVINGKDSVLPNFNATPLGDTLKATLIVLSNKKPFLYFSESLMSAWAGPAGIYQYKNGALKRVVDANAPASDYGMNENAALKKITGKKVIIKDFTFNYTVGALQIERTFVYKKGTLKLASKFGTAHVTKDGGQPTANKTIRVYTNQKCKKLKFKLYKGAKVSFTGYYQSGKRLVLKIKSGGRTGWIRLTKDLVNEGMLSENKPFINTMYRNLG